jgi:hypothetical protein
MRDFIDPVRGAQGGPGAMQCMCAIENDPWRQKAPKSDAHTREVGNFVSDLLRRRIALLWIAIE